MKFEGYEPQTEVSVKDVENVVTSNDLMGQPA